MAVSDDIAGPCAEILEKTDDWEKRNSALIALQALFEEHRNSANIAASFTVDVFRQLKLPLQRTLKDLRSTIAREACKVLEILSEVTGDTMRPLIRELLPTLIELLASGNKVIQGYIGDCMVTIIQHTRFRGLPYIIEQATTNKSKDVRDSCSYFVSQILSNWNPAFIEKDAEALQHGLKKCLEDSSAETRSFARGAFPIFQSHWPQRASQITQVVDARTARMLTASTLSSSTRNTASVPVSAPAPHPSSPKGPAAGAKANKAESPAVSASSARAEALMTTAASAALVSNSDGEESNSGGVEASPGHEVDATCAIDDVPDDALMDTPAEALSTEIELGDVVTVTGRHRGIVRFFGETRFATGMWIGVELYEEHGKNDGSVQDVAYFTCPPRHGLFVKPNLVSRVVPANTTLAAAEPSPLKVSMPTAAAAPSPAEKSISERELLAAHKAHVAQVLQALRIEMQALVQFERRSAGPAPRETTDIGAYIGAVRDGHARVQQSMDSFARRAARIEGGNPG